MSPAIQIVLLMICAFSFYRAVHHARVALLLRRGDLLRQRRVHDQFSVPEPLHDIDAMLRGLEFSPVYAVDQQYALQRGLTTTYVYRHPLAIYASLSPASTDPPFVITYATTFPDDSMVATTYPHGTEAFKPDLDLRFAVHDPMFAFDDHVIRALPWSEMHGDPVVTDDPILSEASERRLMTRHSRHLYGHAIRKNEGAALSMLGLLVILGAILWSSTSSTAIDAELPPNVVVLTGFVTDTVVFLVAIFAGIALVIAANIRSEPARKPKPLDADRRPPTDKRHPLVRPPRTR